MARLLKDVDLAVLGVSDLVRSVPMVILLFDDDAPSKPGGGGVREVKLDEVPLGPWSLMERRGIPSMTMIVLTDLNLS
jgi:hypothetical protein